MTTTIATIPVQVARLQFTIQPLEEMHLGKYPAITLRGGLGYALKQTACNCIDTHEESCIYARLFEEFEGVIWDEQYVPYVRPMIIHTGINHQFTYKKYETYQFEVLLFGEMIQHYDMLILAFKQFGRNGIGDEQQKFRLLQVSSLESMIPTIIYDNGAVYAEPKPLQWDLIQQLPQQPMNVKLTFTTPLRLKVQGEQQYDVSIEVLVDHLLRRMKSLSYFHQQALRVDEDWCAEMIEHAFNVETNHSAFKYVKYNRYSTRQKKHIRIDGIEGHLKLQHVSSNLLALLYVGQFMHIGKQTVFGLGHYQLQLY